MIGVADVQLRDLAAWPPVWVRQGAPTDKTAIDAYLRGEPGVLIDATADVATIVLTIDHDGHTWVGLVPIEVPEARLSAITLFLREQLGDPIPRVAALRLPE